MRVSREGVDPGKNIVSLQVFSHVRIPARVPRLLRFARRLIDLFPWTALGLFVAAAAAGALTYFAYREMDLVLLVLGYGALGLAALSTLFVALGVGLTRLRKLEPGSRELDAETQRPQPTGFSLPALSWLPLTRVRWAWREPKGFELRFDRRLGRVHEQTIATRRGVHESVERRVIVEDVFGLARIARWRRTPLTLRVLPHVGALRQLPVLISYAGGEDWPHPMGLLEGDRLELRRYAPGDPARFIHWKIFARARKLVVRTPERALTQSHRTVAYLASGPDDEASAAAARVAVESRALGEDWAFGADGFPDGCSRIEDAVDAIVRSGEHAEHGGRDLETFLRVQERSGPASLVLFVPPRPGPWLETVLGSLQARRGRARVVIGVDGLGEPDARPWWKRVLTREAEREIADVAELEQVIQKLAPTRAPVIVVDRIRGTVLGEAHRKAVAKAKRAA